MARLEGLMELKNDTARLAAIREIIAKRLYTLVKEEFGDDFVLFVPKEGTITENASKVAKNTVVADVGDVEDKNGTPMGVVVEFGLTVKKWNTVETKSGKIQYGVNLDDYAEIGIKLDEEEEEE